MLDAGDSLVGDQDPARRTQGQTSITAMNMMSYTAMALGPQDLALGPAVLRQRMAEARFAILSANAVVSATGRPVATPYIIRELGGHRVAIVGLSGGKDTAEIAVRDPTQTAQAMVTELAGQADIVILLSHAGAAVDQQMADTVSGVDLIVSGGAPMLAAPWRSEKTGALVVRADQASPGHAGRVLGIARLSFDSRGQVVGQTWQALPLSPEIADDPAMTAWVNQSLRQ